MNIKQQLYCKVTGWNGSFESPGFFKVPETYFQMPYAHKLQHLIGAAKIYFPGCTELTFGDIHEVMDAIEQSNKRPIGSSLEAYKKLADIP